MIGRYATDASTRIVRLTSLEQKHPRGTTRSRCGNRISPLVRQLGSENPGRRARDKMVLEIEEVLSRERGRAGAVRGIASPDGLAIL